MTSGDLSLCSLQDKGHISDFPTAHYHGITITINLTQIDESTRNILEILSIDLEHIYALSQDQAFTIIHTNQKMQSIFTELYEVPEKIRYGYIRVKILEFLLLMTEWKASPESLPKPEDFPESQIQTIKEILSFLKKHYDRHYTISELSEMFGLSPTLIKKCFKGVYGISLYAYIKRYRLQLAEQLLVESKLTIAEIAGQVGYLNPNKFSSAFSKQYGMSPSSFRQKKLSRKTP